MIKKIVMLFFVFIVNIKSESIIEQAGLDLWDDLSLFYMFHMEDSSGVSRNLQFPGLTNSVEEKQISLGLQSGSYALLNRKKNDLQHAVDTVMPYNRISDLYCSYATKHIGFYLGKLFTSTRNQSTNSSSQSNNATFHTKKKEQMAQGSSALWIPSTNRIFKGVSIIQNSSYIEDSLLNSTSNAGSESVISSFRLAKNSDWKVTSVGQLSTNNFIRLKYSFGYTGDILEYSSYSKSGPFISSSNITYQMSVFTHGFDVGYLYFPKNHDGFSVFTQAGSSISSLDTTKTYSNNQINSIGSVYDETTVFFEGVIQKRIKKSRFVVDLSLLTSYRVTLFTTPIKDAFFPTTNLYTWENAQTFYLLSFPLSVKWQCISSLQLSSSWTPIIVYMDRINFTLKNSLWSSVLSEGVIGVHYSPTPKLTISLIPTLRSTGMRFVGVDVQLRL